MSQPYNPESVVPELQLYNSHAESRVQSHEFIRDHQDYNSINHHNNNNLNNNIVVPQYNEETVTVLDYGKHVFSNPLDKIKHYFISLFPIASWILHYNYKWLYGDLVAGITVGVVLVPQSMSYAQLAGLDAQYGLYSSFIGVFTYSFFATSKDVSIGPVAVMSAQVGKVIAKVQASSGGEGYSAPEIATFLSLICGGIAAGIGILRLGFILEFISIPAVMGFMTGSAFSIIVGQVPGLMGYNSLINTRDASYLVVINTLKNLPSTNVNCAFGLVPLFILYLWKFSTEWAQKRWPRYKLYFFYGQQLRNALVIIVATAISWGIVHPEVKRWSGLLADFTGSIKTIGEVPSGLRNVGVMNIPDGIVDKVSSEIPVSVIILLLEHIAISKSFGRVNDYKVVPDQEVIAIGINNLIGTFFNAYPSTGSFSRSALKAKCGVRTPLAGIFTGAVVLLALYCLTQTFFYIPKATLCAIIIHAVSDLLASYTVTWNFWKISPLDCGIFIIAVIITVFASIEDGVYFAICASAAVLLFRVAKPKGQFLGKIKIAEVINPIIDYNSNDNEKEEIEGNSFNVSSNDSSDDVEIHQVLSNGSNYQSSNNNKLNKVKDTFPQSITSPTTHDLVKHNPNIKFHTRWVPQNKHSINNQLDVQLPPPGVIVFKPIETFTYPNASLQTDRVSDEAKRLTKRGKPYSFTDTGSRPWNDPGPLVWDWFGFKKSANNLDQELSKPDDRPILRIVHFDFSSVSSIDVTSIQSLIDLRKALNMYADREVEFHFSGILSPWIRRALLKAGFGTYADEYLVSDTTYVNIAASNKDLESGDNYYFAAVGTDTPYFHLDIPDYE